MLERTCSTSESEIIFNLFMLTRYFHNIVQLFEPLSTVNDSIRIKRNDISKKETKNQKIEFFRKVSKKF